MLVNITNCSRLVVDRSRRLPLHSLVPVVRGGRDSYTWLSPLTITSSQIIEW